MQKRDITKQQILEAAIILFKEKGVQATIVSEIVKKSGVAKGTFFYHYGKKDQIIYEIINMEFGGYFLKPKQILEKKELGACKKLETVLISMFSAFNTSSLLEQIFRFGVPIQFENYINQIRFDTIVPIITTIIEQGNDEGAFEVKNVDVVSSIVIRGIIAYVHSAYKNLNQPGELMKMLHGIEELINNALKASKTLNITSMNNQK